MTCMASASWRGLRGFENLTFSPNFNVTVASEFPPRTDIALRIAVHRNRACRAALGEPGFAHLTIAKEVQNMKLAADTPSMKNHGVRPSASWSPVAGTPRADELRAAADLLNSGRRVAILAGEMELIKVLAHFDQPD
jgi:thiamine pyrophosphate-dependent acetolactate synthase large subunit-like protein